MKTLLLSALVLFSISQTAQAEQDAPIKEKALSIILELPGLFGGNRNGQIDLDHDINFNRVKENDTYQKINRLIYVEGKKEMDSFNPEDGEGVLLAKEQLKGFIDTDLLKVKFDIPYFDLPINSDVYPVSLKFRASMTQRLFKRVKLLVKRTVKEGEKWKGYYQGTTELDGLALKINAFGKVLKMDLLLKGKVIKSLNLSEIETIPEKEF